MDDSFREAAEQLEKLPLPSPEERARWFDAEVEPVLYELAVKCAERGIPFLAMGEADPGTISETKSPQIGASAGLFLCWLAQRAHGNVDQLLIYLIRYLREQKLDHSSIVLANAFGLEPKAADRKKPS